MSKQNHRDRIYAHLLDRIRVGDMDWNDRLVDVSVAAELGVSRMPARDALLRLVAEGYLVTTTRGFVLPRLTPAEVLEVFDLRRLLEPRAAAMAAQAMTDEALSVMGNSVAEGRRAIVTGDLRRLFCASEMFRNAWLSRVPNLTLARTIQRYLVQVQNVRLTTMKNAETLEIIVRGQEELLQAHRARDSVAAGDRMLRFVIEGEQAFRKAMVLAEAEDGPEQAVL